MPLDASTYSGNKVEEAFRYMAKGEHIGKVLIQVTNLTEKIWLNPRLHANEEDEYLITGGLGGFGLELCDWLVNRGARKIVLTSRTATRTSYQQYRIEGWRNKGVNIVVSSIDMTSVTEVTSLLKTLLLELSLFRLQFPGLPLPLEGEQSA